jgi:hypothetical protein
MELTFTTKEIYLNFRAEWKTQYKQLSAQIRQTKLELKKAQREGTASWRHFNACINGKAKAREMLDQLQEAKQEAQRQWLVQRQQA